MTDSPDVNPPSTDPNVPAQENAGGEVSRKRRTGLRRPKLKKSKPGTPAGIELHELDHMAAVARSVRLTCIDYAPGQIQANHITDLDAFIQTHRPAWTTVRWIHVTGLTDTQTIKALAQKYELHPLAVEDMFHVPQRPKVESYEGQSEHRARIFVIARMIQLVNQHLRSQQISLFLGRDTVLTFQEGDDDIWKPVRHRLHTEGTRLRNADASFLFYTLIDAIVDHCFPVLEYYGDQLDTLEASVLSTPEPLQLEHIHAMRRELLLLRREIWPMREVVNFLQRDANEHLSHLTRTYMRDVYDHTIQILDIVETYREMATGIAETYLSSVNNRLNEVMKVLAVFASIFIPLNFLASVFGMNFTSMPLHHPWLFPAFWIVCGAIALAMLLWFRARKWL